jgi:hypothetical protein
VLGRAGAELLGDIRVTSTPDIVQVAGTVSSDEARRQLTTHLEALPLVTVSLQEGEPATVEAASQPSLARWLNQTYARRPSSKDAFISDLVTGTTAVKQRLTVLGTLAARYSEPQTHDFSKAAQKKLQLLLNLHYRALSADLDALEAPMQVLYGSMSRVFPLAQAPADWSQRASLSLPYAVTLDHLVQELLAYDDLPSRAQWAAEHESINVTFNTLWDVVNAAPGRPLSKMPKAPAAQLP